MHPATHFADPIYRQDLDAGVEPRFITYSAEHARQVLGRTVELMTVLIPKAADAAADGENAQWAVFAGGRIGVIRGKALAIAGVQVGPEESEQEERVEGPPK